MKTAFSLLIFIPFLSFAQVNIDFENGQLNGWTQSEPGHWAVTSEQPISGNYSLKQVFDRPEAGRDQISFPLQGLSLSSGTTTWQFSVRHTYSPSSSNNWVFFLAADRDANTMKPGTAIHAFAAGVNFTGSDDLFKIWYLHDGKAETIITSNFNWQSSAGILPAAIEIRRDVSGNWEASIDTSMTFQHFQIIGTGFSVDTVAARYAGISYEYSSSQDRKLWIDDIHINGTFIRDTLPPVFSSYRFPDSLSLAIAFSEAVDLSDASFSMDHNKGEATRFFQPAADSLILYFTKRFSPDTLYHLTLHKVKDLQGNILKDSLKQVSYHLPHYLEVQINEVMADPSPPLGLPEAEYVELYNATEHMIWMNRAIFAFGDKEKILPLFAIPSHGYSILCSATHASLLSKYGKVVAIASMPALSNSGMSLSLLDQDHHLLSHLTYNRNWYHDDYKSEGGWSLEQIDPIHPCPREDNWKAASSYPGGTPGSANSVLAVNPDNVPAGIVNLFLINNHTLFIRLSKACNPVIAVDPSLYQVNHEIGHPVSVTVHAPGFSTLTLNFRKIFKAGMIYDLLLSDKLTDCSGNTVLATTHFQFAETFCPDSLDLVINELLYNPSPGGSDFIEIYNRSDKVIDLHTLLLASRNEDDYRLSDISPVGNEPLLFFPKHYRVFTQAPVWLADHYFTSSPQTFIEMKRVPPLPDDRGSIVLLDTAMHVLDEFHYTDDMQFPLLQSTEGVTLERIHFSSPTQDPLNWHSASTDAGYGTPGVQNSQYSDDPPGTTRITTEPDIISPDNDGYHDALHIHYSFDEPGNVATIIIYDANGRIVRTLANNFLLGKRGEITWDGLDDEKKMPPKGIYLIYVEVFNLKGKVHGYKRTCVLAGRRE